MKDIIYVLDFGSQYSHLITRRIRELGVFAELAAPDISLEKLKNSKGIILSGGPQNLSDSSALKVNKKVFKNHMKVNLRIIYAEKQFLSKLKGVTDPEKKRKTIGELFIRIFEKEAKKLARTKWLVQGTLYTDRVSSGVSSGGKHTAVIKSHHNVGGLPEKFGFKLIEPLRDLYKYEVRKIGDVLGLPKKITYRMPFPGPGLAVRIIGEVTKEKLEILQLADKIVTEEMNKTDFVKDQYFFYFVALPDIRSVGLQGDARTYGQPIILRAVDTAEFLTADWVHLPYSLLGKISTRITNEVKGINRVVYDITSKPPGTVEWE